MKNVKLTEEQAKVLHDALNMGDPQRGLGIPDIRAALPIIDRLEKPARKERAQDQRRGLVEVLFFAPMVLELKQSEYEFCMNKLESSAGWADVTDVGRRVVNLIDYMKEVPSVEDRVVEKK